MPVPNDASHDPDSSSLFYDRLLDYLLVALLAVEGLIAACLGVSVVTSIDRELADEFAAEFAASGDLPLGLSEAELADAVYSLGVWAGGGLVATGVVLLVFGAWFYRYRGRVHDRIAEGRRPPRWHAPLLGGVLATALAFVPFVQFLGGAVAGYLSEGSSTLDGALAGVLIGAPAYVLWGTLAVGSLVAGLPSLVVLIAVIVFLYVAVDVVLAAIGGLVGGVLA